jgi:hypothetical protein
VPACRFFKPKRWYFALATSVALAMAVGLQVDQFDRIEDTIVRCCNPTRHSVLLR